MKNRFNQGFTLIELLVVIAIIGILSSVVLASLNTARTKGANAAVKSNLNNIRAQAEIYYDTNGNYTAVCSDSFINNMLNAASQAGSNNITADVCNPGTNAWAGGAPLKGSEVVNGVTNTWWCVDSTGNSAGQPSALAGNDTQCP